MKAQSRKHKGRTRQHRIDVVDRCFCIDVIDAKTLTVDECRKMKKENTFSEQYV
jgi:hypothetical protein